MRHFSTPEFWVHYRQLPAVVRELADKSFSLVKADPRHAFVRLEKTGRFWSARVGLHYRALAREQADGSLAWFWVGPHATYDQLT